MPLTLDLTSHTVTHLDIANIPHYKNLDDSCSNDVTNCPGGPSTTQDDPCAAVAMVYDKV